MELRCDSGILHGIVSDSGDQIEFKCRSNRCGHERGVVALHIFNIRNGTLTTELYREPVVRREVNNGSTVRNQEAPDHSDG